MEVFWISASGIEAHAVAELAVLAARTDGVLWLDLPADEVETTPALTEVFGFHGLALRDCRERSLMPKIHVYADHLFLILHVPEPGAQGHVHLLEIDLFIGRRYLVTVHGPLGAGVSMATAMRESHEVSDRIAAGRFHPKLPFEIAYAIISRQTRHMEAVIAERARTIAGFEQQIMRGQVADEHRTLEAIFLLRHEVLTLRTIAAQSGEVVTRMATLAPRVWPADNRTLIDDLVDQFHRVRSLCSGELDFLQGVIDYYQIRTTTKMNLAMERLTLLSALLLPITAIASLYGMNIIVFDDTNWFQLSVVAVVMLTMISGLFYWAKRQGWW